jgi:hypothetical protein
MTSDRKMKMASNTDGKKDFLLIEYKFMEKAYELQFNHFMGVFYFWTAVVGVPITAGILTNLELNDFEKLTAFGILCIVVCFLGFFVSLKMFDIRQSQFRYIKKMDEIRDYFWRINKIEENSKISHIGKNADYVKIAKTDFGMYMALIMSITHGILLSVGTYLLLLQLYPMCNILSILLGIILLVVNFCLYFKFMKKLDSLTK